VGWVGPRAVAILAQVGFFEFFMLMRSERHNSDFRALFSVMCDDELILIVLLEPFRLHLRLRPTQKYYIVVYAPQAPAGQPINAILTRFTT